MSEEEKKAIEKIEDFLTTNKIVSISSDEIANSEELEVFISKNEYLAIEFIANMFLKQLKEIEKLKYKNNIMNVKIHKLLDDNMELLRKDGNTDKLNYKYIECPKVEAEYYKSESYINENYISKDKIKAKIEELEQDEDFYREQDRIYEYEGKLNLLQSLLEED